MSKLVENIDYNFDASGFMVLTEKYLKDQGNCCGNGCKHCPYQYENVPEPRRTELLSKRRQLPSNN